MDHDVPSAAELRALFAASGRRSLEDSVAALVRETEVAWGSDDGANAPPVPDGAFTPSMADAHYRRLFVNGAAQPVSS